MSVRKGTRALGELRRVARSTAPATSAADQPCSAGPLVLSDTSGLVPGAFLFQCQVPV